MNDVFFHSRIFLLSFAERLFLVDSDYKVCYKPNGHNQNGNGTELKGQLIKNGTEREELSGPRQEKIILSWSRSGSQGSSTEKILIKRGNECSSFLEMV